MHEQYERFCVCREFRVSHRNGVVKTNEHLQCVRDTFLADASDATHFAQINSALRDPTVHAYMCI